MHFFTSITTNYLPKARVLAESVKKYCEDSFFTLLVSDDLPADFDIERESFDEVLFIYDLDIPVDNLEQWIFKHTVVELCTAVKGAAIYKLLKESKYNKVIYLDPDTAVFDNLVALETTLEDHSVVLTPHLTAPEKTYKGILDNELCALQHGVYNLGFLAIRNSENGMKFAKWWRDRLVDLCYDDIPRGIFTDQKWVDMAPAIFEDIFIERNPGYNVATWNMSNRIITKSGDKYFVNDEPLQFYHFSGFDSGAQEAMLSIYGNSDAAFELRQWYIKKQNAAGQEKLGKTPGKYNYFYNGEQISKQHRSVMIAREDVSDYFKNSNPFDPNASKSYYNWFNNEILPKVEKSSEQKDAIIQELECEVQRLKNILKPLKPFKGIYKFVCKFNK